MLELNEVSKVYRVGTFGSKELRAVNKVSFSIKPGEVVSLIGESGSGKTTIGKMILRLTRNNEGVIRFQDTDVSTLEGEALKEYYRKVQGVFQDPFSSYNPIFKADRVFELIRQEFFPDMDRAEWDRKLITSLECVGINPEHCLCKYPHQLSGGQLQRLLIARALMLDVDFLVADEIISMLDASTRIDVLNLLAELKTHGLSILFITHDLSLGYYISDRSVILYRGNVVEMGTTEKVFSNPMHPYTKMLIASVPRMDKKWDGALEKEASGSLPAASGYCAYYDRCPAASSDGRCAQDGISLFEVEEDHFVACGRIQ